MIRRLVLIAAILLGLLVACGIPDNGQVSTIQTKDLRTLRDTIPSTTTSTIPPTTIVPVTTTTALNTATTTATEDVTIYFISGAQLKPLPRALAKPPNAATVIAALQQGPPAGDENVGIRSAVPTHEQAPIGVTDDDSGVATITLPPGFFEQIPPEDQLLAIGQIVLSVTEVAGIGQVLFMQDGLPRGVPRKGGGSSDGVTPLARRDYTDLLNPPVPTTTTTLLTTTTVATTTV